MVTREEVVAAYRFLLGRDPESAAIVDGWIATKSWLHLRNEFIESAEFRAKIGLNKRPSDTSFIGPSDVEVDLDSGSFSKLMDHVTRTWEELGATQPHWSVLTDSRFLPEHIQDNVEEFYRSGAYEVRRLEAAFDRAHEQADPDSHVLEPADLLQRHRSDAF